MKALLIALIIAALSSAAAGAEIRLERFSIEIDGRARREVGDVDGVRIERRVVANANGADRRIFTRIVNDSAKEITLGAATLLETECELPAGGAPAAVIVSSDATLSNATFGPAEVRKYAGSTVLGLVGPDRKTTVVIGYLTAAVARPELAATVQPDGKTTLAATQRLMSRKLPAKEAIDLDVVYVARGEDPYAALEAYGDAAARQTHALKTKATALWCSWYAHRMDVSEKLVLANAAVAAKHFKPLGFEFMQLDHGWQRGDITGDWVVDSETFPHGLKWLADELKSRYGLKLGLWIAPTDVAETSETYKLHAEWLLKGGDGKPLVNWKWYWKPNPNCYELDATQPAAKTFLRDTFARLRHEGADYFKIDFIASSGGEQFVQSDPFATRGWSNLRNAIHEIRAGAGEDAWIRYCQTPPLLGSGIASSAYGGDDTLDAGIPSSINNLRDNARSLAAGWWINDRLYHREVCDMSVRMQADVEEARLRLALMTLADCSISFSDELTKLPLSRIRMMQQCLPPPAPAPGGPRMRPVDLFDRTVPSVWWTHCKTAADEWEVVGLFNFEDTPQERAVDFAALGIGGDVDVAAFELWEQRFVGVQRGKLALMLPPHSSRILSLRRLTDRPQVIGTDMHVLQGFHELTAMKWDAASGTLSGRCARAAGLDGRLIVRVPAGWQPKFDFPLNETSAQLTHLAGDVWAHEMHFEQADRDWSLAFVRAK